MLCLLLIQNLKFVFELQICQKRNDCKETMLTLDKAWNEAMTEISATFKYLKELRNIAWGLYLLKRPFLWACFRWGLYRGSLISDEILRLQKGYHIVEKV